jgi:predicted nucleotidyltransferase
MVASQVRDIASRYIELLKREGIKIDQAYLYGSWARNEAGSESDIDLMLVSDNFDTDDDLILSKPWRYTAQIDPRIEPVAIGTKRFMNDASSPLIEAVKRDGILLL